MINSSHGFAIVTPASKGLGFAFAQHLLSKTPLPIVATVRRNKDEVHDKLLSGKNTPRSAEERLSVLEVDVTDESTISSMASHLHQTYPKTPLRLALTLPGILHVEKSPSQIDAASAMHSFQVNALGPMLLMKHLAPFLPKKSARPFPTLPQSGDTNNTPLSLPAHSIYATLAARVGSITDNASGGWYSYRASKAAVFQLTKTFDLYLRARSRDRALAVALHPGTVRTDFTREYWGTREMLEPQYAAERLLNVLIGLSADFDGGRGRCWDWKGVEVCP